MQGLRRTQMVLITRSDGIGFFSEARVPSVAVYLLKGLSRDGDECGEARVLPVIS